MTDLAPPLVPSRSQIPVAINRRHSLNILQQSTNSVNSNASTASSSRATSPLLALGKPSQIPVSTKTASNGINGGGGKRYSLLPAGNGRKPSFGDKEKDDDPCMCSPTTSSLARLAKICWTSSARLKAQIALLQSSLHASHQRIVTLTAELNLNSSTSSSVSPGALSPGFMPHSPVLYSPSDGGLAELPEVDTPFGDTSVVAEEDEGDLEPEELPKPDIKPRCE
jgi:hypothetical protein